MFNEDFSLFFNDFGTTVSVNSAEIQGIFSNEYVNAEGISTSAPHLFIQTSSVDELEIRREDEVLFNKTAYSVASIESDGTGMSVIFLEKKWAE